MPRTAALDILDEAAHEAGVAETRYRQSYADEILRLETARRRAYRRFHFVEALVAADARAADRDASQAAQKAAAASELGWDASEAGSAEALGAMAVLADAIHDDRLARAAEAAEPETAGLTRVSMMDSEPAATVLGALAEFEARYEAMRGKAFASEFDRDFPETPLVDF